MRYLIVLLTFSLAGLTSSPVAAQQEKNPLLYIPSDFALLVKLSAPTPTLKRAEEALESAATGMGGLVGMIPTMVGEMIANPDLTGADQAGDFWMALKFKAGEDPSRVFLIPSKTPKELQEAVGEGYTFYNQGRWVIYSESSDAIELFKKLKSGEGRSLSKFVDAGFLEILEKGDLAIWMDLPTLRRVYQEEIDFQKSQVEDFLKDLPGHLPVQQGIDPAQIAKMYDDLFQMLASGMEDSRAFCGSISCQKGGVFVDSYLAFSFSSATAKQLKSVTTSDFRGLTKLPQSHVIYAGINGFSEDFLRWSINISSSAMDEKYKQSLMAVMEEMIGLKMGPMTYSMDVGGLDEGAFQMVSQVELAEPQKMQAMTRKFLESMPEFQQQGLIFKQEFKPEAETYGKYKADLLSMKIEVQDPASPQGMIQQQMLGMMYGPEGMKTRTFYLQDRVLQVMGNENLANEAITAYEGKTVARKSSDENASDDESNTSRRPGKLPATESRDEDEAETRQPPKTSQATTPQGIEIDPDAVDSAALGIRDSPKNLLDLDQPSQPEAPPANPPKQSAPEIIELPPRDVRDAMKLTRGKLSTRANFILMLDLPTILVKILQRVPIVKDFGISTKKLVAAIETPSFTGISLGADANALRFKLIVPTAQMKGIGDIVSVFMPLMTKFATGEPLVPPPAAAPAEEPQAAQPTGDDAPAATTPPPNPKFKLGRKRKKDDDD